MITCQYCDKEFKYESEKKRHEKSHIPQFECSECFKRFSFISALRRHQKQHKRTGRVNCSECSRSFRDDTLLQRHIKYAHKEMHICSKCQAKFNSLQALQSHQKTHKPKSERRYKCSNNGCMKTFNFAHHLRNHELTHSGVKQHYCSSCGKGFIQLHHLKAHLRSHQPNSWLKCSIPSCDKLFTTDYAIKRHLATHRIKDEDIQSSGICSNIIQDTKQELTEEQINRQMNDIDTGKMMQKDTMEWFNKYQLTEDLPLEENIVTEPNNNVHIVISPKHIVDSSNIIYNSTQRRDLNLIEKKNDNCKACVCDKVKRCSIKNNMPEMKYNSDGTIKLKELIDEDIEIITYTRKIKEVEEDINEFSNNLIPYNSCKAVLGKCIVSGSGTMSEECLCAKMAIDDNQMISQEIDEITPHPVMSMV